MRLGRRHRCSIRFLLLVVVTVPGCGSDDDHQSGTTACALRLTPQAGYDLVLSGTAACPGDVRLTLRVATGDRDAPVWRAAADAPVQVDGGWTVDGSIATRALEVTNPGAATVRLLGLEWTAAPLGVAADRLLHNGYQSWTYTGIERIPARLDDVRGTAPHGGDDENTLGEVPGVSWWYTGLGTADGRGLVVGADGGTVLKTYIAADANRLRIVMGGTGDGLDLRPGQRRTLDGVFVTLGDVVAGLDAYARHVARRHPPQTPRRPALAGWGSWNVYYDQVTAELMRQEAAWAAEQLVPLGMTDFLLDDGYEPYWGRWVATDDFGAALDTLAEEQRVLGLRPAIWTAPMYVNVQDPLVPEHPDWFLRTFDGEVRVFPQLDGRRLVTLDITHPEARAFILDQLRALWAAGYRTFKLDFLYAGAIEGLRYEPVTALESYQRWMQAIRETLPDAHLLGCGAPQLPSVGWVDSMRTGPDIAYGSAPVPRYPFYAGEARHTVLRGLTDAWWAIDPDFILLRGTKIQDLDAWTTVVASALGAGNYLLGDPRQAGDLRTRMALDPEIRALRDGVAARARDLLAQADPRLIPIQLLDPYGETEVPHLWEKRAVDGQRHWLAVFAWQAAAYRTDLDLPAGAVEILPPASASSASTTWPIAGRQTIEVPRHGVRLFRWQ